MLKVYSQQKILHLGAKSAVLLLMASLNVLDLSFERAARVSTEWFHGIYCYELGTQHCECLDRRNYYI
jgi:hypothetical protein